MTRPAEFFRNARDGGLILISLSAAGLAGCSDAELNVETPLGFGTLSEIQQGIFRAGNVEGLEYVSGDETGVTDANGAFTCTTGEPLRFSLGALELGAMSCATLAHPAALSESGTLLDTRSLNITRLLLILDEDGNFENGIRISEEIRTLADSWLPIDLSADDFAAELTQIVSDIASVENRTVTDLPSTSEAFAILDASVSCAFSGTYVNLVPSGPFGGLTSISLTVYRESDTGNDVGDFLLLRLHPQSQIVKVASTSIELMTLPGIEGPGVSGAFFTPDQASGDFSGAYAQQEWDRSGTFGVKRLGTNNTGEYRITGGIEKLPEDTSGVPVRFRVALTLDGRTLAGEAFDVVSGGTYAVTGMRKIDSDEIEFEVETVPGVATATLVFDSDDSPVGLVGNWPGVDEDLFSASVCRLI